MPDVFAEKSERFTITIDRARGFVFADLVGFWSVDDVMEFRPALERAASISRTYHGRAMVLFDLTRSHTMSSSLFDEHERNGGNCVAADDDVAVVLLSSLLKLQTKRMNSVPRQNAYFSSRAEAETWLETRLRTAA